MNIHPKDIKPYLASGVLILAFCYFFVTEDPNDQILIAIVGWGGMVLGYYFGSSSSGAKKDETINNLTTNKMSYTVAVIDETTAVDLAQKSDPAFKCSLNGNFYTYPDVYPSAPTATIGDAENDEMFVIEWNGTTPIFKKRKMFPR